MAINVVIISLLVFGVIRSSKQRRPPCLWLLLGVICANLLTLVWDILLWLPFGGHGNVGQDVMTSSRVACILMLHLHIGFDTASVPGSSLLVCHIFLRIYEPKSTNGQRTFRFWIQAEAAIWTASIAFAIGMWTPDTHKVTYEHENPVRQYCTVYYRKGINEVFSLLFFLIPLMHALPMALLSLRLNAGNRRESQTEVELQPFPVTSQPAVESVEDESGKQEEECLQNERHDYIMAAEDGNRGSAILPWVIFIIVNTFLGLGLRIPYHLQQQDFFRRLMFNAGIDITDQSLPFMSFCLS